MALDLLAAPAAQVSFSGGRASRLLRSAQFATLDIYRLQLGPWAQTVAPREIR